MLLVKRIGAALDSARAAVVAAESRMSQGEPAALPSGAPESLGALAVGLSPRELKDVLPALAKARRPDDAFVILITDRREIGAFQMEGVVSEYLPDPVELKVVAPDHDADLYLRRRLVLIHRKWNLRRILTFGAAAERRAKAAVDLRTGLPADAFARGRSGVLAKMRGTVGTRRGQGLIAGPRHV